MELSTILRPNAVKVLSAVSSKKRLFQELADLTFTAHGLEPNKTVEALQAREALGPTGVGHGVALPHARMENVEEVISACVVLEKPVDFGSVDRQPVDIAFALFAPEQAGVEHLKALALVSRTLRVPAICSKLRSNLDEAKIYAILCEAQAVKAA